jgi:hypothetical protein
MNEAIEATRPATFMGIRPGDRVALQVPNGIGRYGQEYKTVSGRAVMCFDTHVVVNLGGRYGTPGVVTEDNYVNHRKAGARKKTATCAGQSLTF